MVVSSWLLYLHELGGDVVELGDANGRGLADVRVLVLEASAQRLAEVFGDLLDSDAAHRADSQRPNQRILSEEEKYEEKMLQFIYLFTSNGCM
jgi:hypothetical protein